MNQKLCTKSNKANKTLIMSGKNKLIIKRSNGCIGERDNNIEKKQTCHGTYPYPLYFII